MTAIQITAQLLAIIFIHNSAHKLSTHGLSYYSLLAAIICLAISLFSGMT